MKLLPRFFAALLLLTAVSTVQAATNCATVTEIPQSECESLLELYHSTNGENWENNSGWNVTQTPCSWFGVACENGRVTKLSFFNNALRGTLPDFNLPNLQELYLDSNQLSGSIPNFSNLPNLQWLWLDNNQLSGSIPNFSNLPNLQSFYLDSNQLSGSIPNFSNLPNLQELSLDNNQLSGTISSFVQQITDIYDNYDELTLHHNCGLTTSDPTLAAFLDQQDPDWQVRGEHCLAVEAAPQLSNTTDIFEAIAEVRGGEIYLPRIGGDFQSDITHVQLNVVDADNYIYELQANWQVAPSKEGVLIQYDAANQTVSLPAVSVGNQYCRNIRLKLVNPMPMQFQVVLPDNKLENLDCGYSLNDLLNNTQITQVSPSRQAALPENRVYLLIHGMSSGPETWDSLVNYWINTDFFKDEWGFTYTPEESRPGSADRATVCPEIMYQPEIAQILNPFMEGDIPNDYTDALDGNGQCYRIKFGTHYRYGLDGQEVWEKGDGATFEQLGKEVGAAIKLILQKQPDAQITLVGHSRGGLAARAFLQTPSTERNAVKGLLTISTPHLGSPFGKIQEYIVDCTSTGLLGIACSQIANFATLGGFMSPTVGDLSVASAAIHNLNQNVGNLPSIVYGQIVSPSVEFGNLLIDNDIVHVYDLFNAEAERIILDGHSREFYQGDGIVPTLSQQMQSIIGFPASQLYELQLTEPVVHVKETEEVQAITTMLLRMAEGD